MTEDDYKAVLRQAQEKLQEQAALLERLTATPFALATVLTISSFSKRDVSVRKGQEITIKMLFRNMGEYQDLPTFTGTVLDVDQDDGYIQADFAGNYRWINPSHFDAVSTTNETKTCVIAFEGKALEVEAPSEIVVRPGDVVRLSAETMQIVEVAEHALPGEISVVRRSFDGMSEVDYQGTVRIVCNGRLETHEKGDRVVLDSSGSVIMQNLGKDDESFSFTTATNVTWSDIGGLEDAKRQMIEAIEMPHHHADLYRHYGKRPLKGVLLYGPPGCGKTMLGKAAATSLAQLYGGSMESSGFLYVKGPEILDKYIGVAEATIRQLFERSRRHHEEHGFPAVLFIDEADAILGKRGSGISSDIERTIVPMFLTEMDGLEDSGAVVILATNRPDVLDPAVVRDGRIDRKVMVTRPTRDTATNIFEIYLGGVPFHNGSTVQQLAEVGRNELFREDRVLYTVDLAEGDPANFTLGHICNGGLIAGVVDKATSIAMHRDIAAGGQPQGLYEADLVTAVDSVFAENVHLNHSDEMADFVEDFRDNVVNIRRLRQVAA